MDWLPSCRALGLMAVFAAAPTLAVAQSPTPSSCEALAKVPIAQTTVAVAQMVSAGSFQPPTTAGTTPLAAVAGLPTFCRVVASVTRPGDTPVGIEVWLPARGWNGEFQPSSSGFTGGAFSHAAMGEILRTGTATASTNRGHDLGGPWKVSDMTSQPYHLMADRAKAILAIYYGTRPRLSLMNECGGGGSRDVLQLVQDFPQDVDAAAAVGFVYDPTHHGIGQWWVYQATHKDAASYIPPAKYRAIHQAALNACDARDGLKDGIIADPPRCAYDPAVLACRGGDGPDCLTPSQIDAVRKIYSPAVHARTGRYLFAAMPPGGELRWDAMAGPTPYSYLVGFYRNQVFKDQAWDYRKEPPNFDTHVDLAEAPGNRVIDAMNPDIGSFVDRGGKLLLVGGWNDHTLAPGSFVDYYEAVVKKLGANRIRNSVRLFMVPGMDHCFTPAYKPEYQADLAQVLRQWKQTGTAPDQLVVSRIDDGRAPVKQLACAYPRVPYYKGSGDATDPRSFECRAP
jgi:feruloyl esterase